jgi:4-hydroxy-tetrahydrodipicolinate synthase
MAIHTALAAGDYARANALISTMNSFEELRAEEGNGTNVTVVKSALAMMGQDCGHVRPPGAWPLTERQSAELRRRLTQWGLIDAAAGSK